MSRAISLAVVGATGLVGEALLALLADSDIKFSSIHALASDESAGKRVEYAEKMLKVEALESFDFSSVEVAIFAVPAAVSAQHSRAAAEQGCLALDLSGVWLADPSVPVWCAGVQDVDTEILRETRLLSVMTGAAAVIAEYVHALSDLRPRLASSVVLLPASAGGRDAVEDLARQTARLLSSQDPEPGIFPAPSAFAVFSAGVSATGSGPVAPEQTAQVGLSRLRALAAVQNTVQVSWVPSFFGMSLGITVHCEQPVSADVAAQMLEQAGMPPVSAELGREPVTLTGELPERSAKVANLAVGGVGGNQLSSWIGVDNVRYGAAFKGVQILQLLIKDYL
ncbi:MAG: hypothetical protein KBT87_05105 [Gammaproteobacteria bacterium]|nr:hypothetical protein [Gammaproteobacteria bacterium]MBQ0774032.1 hypothetical protein [Gammaproteobacteria bacterium]